MHWLKKRLEELDLTGAQLAKAIGIEKQRVYEFWKPPKRTGKPRRIQPNEWAKMAVFLQWSLEELMAKAQGDSALGSYGTSVGVRTVTNRESSADAPTVRFLTARGNMGRWEGIMLSARDEEAGQPHRFEIDVLDEKNHPVYRLRDILTIDPDYRITIGEDCIFSTEQWPPKGGFCIIARLAKETPDNWECQDVVTGDPFYLPRADFPSVWTITGRRRPPV